MYGEKGGFTLVELMVALAMAAIIITMALPDLAGLVESSRAAAGANSFVTALNLARTAAIKQGVPVSICPRSGSSTASCSTANDWSLGWIVFTDANENGSFASSDIIRLHGQLSGANNGAVSLTDNTSLHRLTFNATGSVDVPSTFPAVGCVLFSLTVNNGHGVSANEISVNPQGGIESVNPAVTNVC